LTELYNEARASGPPNRPATPGEIGYDEAHEAITDLWDARAEQERREYTDYADRLTSAVQARIAALKLPTPVTVNITLAPDGASSQRRDWSHPRPIGAAWHSPRSARRGSAVVRA
jgi:hypothetical protein